MLACDVMDEATSRRIISGIMSRLPPTLWNLAIATALIIGFVFAVVPRPSLAAEPTIALTAEEKVWLDRHRVVRVMVGTWPPFHFVAETGEHLGLALDYARQILGELGLEIEPVPILWHDALEHVRIDRGHIRRA